MHRSLSKLFLKETRYLGCMHCSLHRPFNYRAARNLKLLLLLHEYPSVSMRRSAAKLPLLLLIATAVHSFLFLAAADAVQLHPPGCSPHERDALLAFKQGINDTYDVLASWQLRDHDCCRWTGVACSNVTGHVHVVELDLSGTYLVGQISPSLLSLEHLELLDLGYTFLQGPADGRVPGFLGSLNNLRHLDLTDMPFTGPVPPQLGNLSKLEYLSLSCADTMHGTYSADISWLTRLPLLVHLDMSSVNLSTVAADWPLVMNMVPSLEALYLPGCSLPAANHSLTHLNLTSLQYLELSSNYFDHPVAASWFWNVTSMKHLGLYNTYLHGPFPDALGSMTALQQLDFSDNGNAATMAVDLRNLCELELLWLDTGLSPGNITEFLDNLPVCTSNKLLELRLSDNFMFGRLPDKMRHLTSLSSLSLFNNNVIGAIPAGIGDCTNLRNLDLSDNHLTGSIPQGIGNCTKLVHLDLSNNHLNGTIPPGVGNCTHLEDLVLSNNHLTGKVPSKISALSNLTILELSYNNLHGVIAEEYFVSLESLKHIDLSHNSLSGPLPSEYRARGLLALIFSSNNFTGHIPESICELQILIVLDLSNNLLEGELPRCSRMPNMIFLLLSNNNLSGEFPSSLQTYPSLVFLDLSWNNFNGPLPLWIGDLAFLRVLRLSHNMFYGEIPVTITNLNLLCHLNLAGNRMSGAIPRTLSNFTAMTQRCSSKPGVDMFVWYTGREGKFREVWTVATKRRELEYGAGIFEVLYVDLSLNRLTGGIPDEITSLYGLVNLNLSWNRLSGNIPAKIGDIESLESLDLSRNNLSGEIPPSLSDLSYLSSLDLSYNSLAGRVPTGRQLDTLYSESPSMYSGNVGLCGPPLRRRCSRNYVARHGDRQRSRRQVVYDPAAFFYFGIASGFMAGLWVVFCALLFKRAWRDAYFRVLDMLYGEAY